MTENPTALLRQRLFALWADAVQAIANGDPIDTVEVHAEAAALINAAFAEQAKRRETRRRRQVDAMLKRRR
jgi:hypothetical protein